VGAERRCGLIRDKLLRPPPLTASGARGRAARRAETPPRLGAPVDLGCGTLLALRACMLAIAPSDQRPERSGIKGVSPTETSVVQRCRSRDADAWRVLHRTYVPMVTGFLRRLGVEGADLEDACQEVFVGVLRYLPTFRGEATFKTWIFHLCATEARKARSRARVADTVRRLVRLEHAASPCATGGPAMSPERARRKVDDALASLKQDERLVFVLFEMEGLSGDQVAARAGCAVSRVWQQLHHARRKFRTAVEGGPQN
jgi:RNA polymerase sigma-70 factor, ECF subfamily